MNEHAINHFAEQLGSVSSRAMRITSWPLADPDTMVFITRREIDCGFDEATNNDFEAVISELLKKHKWSEKYSERFLREKLIEVIVGLLKTNQLDEAHEAFAKIVVGYETFNTENVVFIPLGGIILNLPELTIGKITFRQIARGGAAQEPFARIDAHMTNPAWAAQHANVKNHFFGGNAISKVVCTECRVVAEPQRAEERAVEECNRVLELLRFAIPSLYKGFERVEVGYLWEILEARGGVLTVQALTPAYHFSSRKSGPASLFELSESTTQALESLGIFRIGKILQKNPQQTNDFERVILRAIHWYGASVNQTEIENKFLNLLISIESLLTPKEREPVANAIAEGVALVLGDNLERRRHLKKRMKELYGQRSGLSHGGQKEILETDLLHLQDAAEKLLVWAIKQVDNFKSHQELFDWIETQKLS
jgi:hypothetical protein